MRCASCAKLHFSDILHNQAVRLHDSVEALIASAEKGCDLCKLCWTRCVDSGYLKLDTTKVADDNSVWLEGQIFPGRNPVFHLEKAEGSTATVIHIFLGDFVLPNHRRLHVAELAIFADPGTPAALVLRATWTTVDRNPQGYIDFARRSVDSCRRYHKLCFLASSSNKAESQMPTRLIDLGEPHDKKSARLVITSSSEVRAPYAALSYCWGKKDESRTMLRDQNLEELRSRIDEEQLSKAHRDAFQLARDLGYRYIWIDALCIVQGNDGDWEHESKRMSQVYGHAALTIIAGRAADCKEGFLENTLRQAVSPCAIPFYYEELKGRAGVVDENGEMGKLWVTLPRSIEDGPVSERGWCFQEAMLSSRAIIFGKEQLRFQCREVSIWEDGQVRRSPLYRIQNIRGHVDGVRSPALAGLNPSGLNNQAGDAQERVGEDPRQQALIYWYKEILWYYTKRKTTNPADVFAALSGLAQAAQSKIRSRYLAGLWEVDIVRGLLWKPTHAYVRGGYFATAAEHAIQRGTQRRQIICNSQDVVGKQSKLLSADIPSWSWAAIQGQIGVENEPRREVKYHGPNVLIRPKYEGRWTRDSTCHATAVKIVSCELEFFGRPQQVRAVQDLWRRSGWTKVSAEKRDQFFGGRVNLMPMREDETKQTPGGNRDPDDSNHIVATGIFDVVAERVSNCWCLPVTKEEGLILIRDKHGKFRRAGTMTIKDLAWMMSAEEGEICLI